eukprot:Polyplicarium_translucidae@DN3294_c1_g1_i3.p1
MVFAEKCHWSGQRNASLTTSMARCGERFLLQAAVLAAASYRFVGDHSDDSDRAVIEGGGPSCDDFNAGMLKAKGGPRTVSGDDQQAVLQHWNVDEEGPEARQGVYATVLAGCSPRHTGKTYQCPHCDERFDKPNQKKAHIARAHAQVECDICKKQFTKSNIRAHMRTHTGEES